jgi:hypothetical protein
MPQDDFRSDSTILQEHTRVRPNVIDLDDGVSTPVRPTVIDLDDGVSAQTKIDADSGLRRSARGSIGGALHLEGNSKPQVAKGSKKHGSNAHSSCETHPGFLEAGLAGYGSDYIGDVDQFVEDASSSVTGPTGDMSETASISSITSWSSKASNWSSHLSTMSRRAVEKASRGMSNIANAVRADGDVVDAEAYAEAKMIARWVFKVAGKVREVNLAHARGIWYIRVDSESLLTKSHSNAGLRRFRASIEFPIPLSEDESRLVGPLIATMTMDWIPQKVRWYYTLILNGSEVPQYWSKAKGLHQSSQVCKLGRGIMLAVPEDANELGIIPGGVVHPCFEGSSAP